MVFTIYYIHIVIAIQGGSQQNKKKILKHISCIPRHLQQIKTLLKILAKV